MFCKVPSAFVIIGYDMYFSQRRIQIDNGDPGIFYLFNKPQIRIGDQVFCRFDNECRGTLIYDA